MQGKKQYQEKLFINFQLSDRVPEDNFYRRLKETVDFSYLYKRTAEYYGSEGQKSIDPVVFMKLMLVGYLENLNSDRRIISHSKMRMDILYFLGYDLDEELPWHSTLSRTRQLYGQEVFAGVFKSVLKQCIDKGMISGRRQAIDGVYVKANASLDNMVEREVLADADIYSSELEANKDDALVANMPDGHFRDSNGLRPKKNPHNDTHYNPSDPDAKMSVKRGKAMALNYLGEVSVDTSSHMITHIQAFTADNGDNKCLPAVLEKVIENLEENGLTVEEVVADKGFSGGEALRALKENNITGYIPNRPQFVYERPGFVYHGDGDYYTCPNNKQLTYRGTYKCENSFNKHYRCERKDCNACPLRGACMIFTEKKGAYITDTIDRPYYASMHVRMQSKKAKWLLKKRQSTVEPVIGTLVNYLGMKRVNTKGLTQANKCLTMAAVAYNIKKLLRHNSIILSANVQALRKQAKIALNGVLNSLRHLKSQQMLSNTVYLLSSSK